MGAWREAITQIVTDDWWLIVSRRKLNAGNVGGMKSGRIARLCARIVSG